MQWKILAGLRFFLALIVVSDHIVDISPEAGLPWSALNKLGGFSAVLGFLLISGYSIAHSITKKPEGFYKRRFLRIYPLYACSIFASLVPFLLLGPKINLLFHGVYARLPLDAWTVIGNLAFLQGFLVSFIGSNPPLWTLSIEWVCYLLAPFFLKLGNQRLLILIGLSSLIFGIYPYLVKFSVLGLKGYHYSFLPYGLGFIILMWAWLLGFFYLIFPNREQSNVLLIALGCILLEQNQVVSSRWAISTYLISALVLIYSCHIKLPGFCLNLLNYLGEISYPLYLFHVPVFICTYSFLGSENPTLLVIISLLASILFYHLLDRPLRAKKHPSRFNNHNNQLTRIVLMNTQNSDKDSIVLVGAADDGYAMPLAVTMRSALENIAKDRQVKLFIIDGGIKQPNKRKILKSLSSEKCEVRWISRPDELLGKIQVLTDFKIENVPVVGTVTATKHVNIATYYRLLIPELLPREFKKAIYLDSDMVVIGDLAQLWEIDMGENYLLATRDLLVPYVSSPAGLMNYRELGIPANAKYMTPGVLVIDLEKWRTDSMSAKCVKYLQENREYVRWHDTDVLNAMFPGNWEELDPRWNQMTNMFAFTSWQESPLSEESYKQVLHHPYIIHFSTAAKPWNTREEHPFKHLWFKYLDMTAWSGWRLTIWRRLWRRFIREIKKFRPVIAPPKTLQLPLGRD